MKKKLSIAVRIIISLLLLGYVLSNANLSAIGASLKSVRVIWAFAAFILLNVGKVLTGLRWRILLAAHGLDIPLPMLIASLYVGQFFNSFLPSTIGGDAIRAFDTAKYSGKKAKSVTAVFLDRLIGMFALAFLGLAALGAGALLEESVQPFLWAILLAVAASASALLVIFNDTLARHCNALLRRLKMDKIARKINNAYTALIALKNQKSVLINAFLFSVILQINVVLFYYFVSLALNLDLSIIYFFIIIPIILVILLVPFSINGIGLRESAYVFFLGMLGVASENAIAFSWLAFGLMLTQGVIGGVIFALRRDETVKKLRDSVSLT